MYNMFPAATLAYTVYDFGRTCPHPVRSGMFLDPVELIGHSCRRFFMHGPLFGLCNKDLSRVNSQSGRIDIDTLAFL